MGLLCFIRVIERKHQSIFCFGRTDSFPKGLLILWTTTLEKFRILNMRWGNQNSMMPASRWLVLSICMVGEGTSPSHYGRKSITSRIALRDPVMFVCFRLWYGNSAFSFAKLLYFCLESIEPSFIKQSRLIWEFFAGSDKIECMKVRKETTRTCEPRLSNCFVDKVWYNSYLFSIRSWSRCRPLSDRY